MMVETPEYQDAQIVQISAEQLNDQSTPNDQGIESTQIEFLQETHEIDPFIESEIKIENAEMDIPLKPKLLYLS